MASATKHQIRVYTGSTLGRLAGTAGTAVIETGEFEGNLGGRTYAAGVKPKIDTTSLTVSVGGRDALNASVTYASESALNTLTGFANFRLTYRYLRARITISGAFNAAIGVDADVRPAGV